MDRKRSVSVPEYRSAGVFRSVEQRDGVVDIAAVMPLDHLIENGLQCGARLAHGRLVAIVPAQAEQAGRGSQLERARALAASRLQRTLKFRLDLFLRAVERRQKLRPEPSRLCLPKDGIQPDRALGRSEPGPSVACHG